MSPPAGLVVRARRPADAEALATLQNLPGYRHGTLRTPFTTPEEIAARLGNPAPGSLSIVAELDGRLVGNAGLLRFGGRQGHVASLGMGVHDDFCGRGIGTALLAAVLDAADNWLAIRRVELEVYPDNSSAIRLYERHGFVREGVKRSNAFRAGAYVDSVMMARLRTP